MSYGPDISNNNGRVDWAALHASGKAQFVYAKASEGQHFRDQYFHSHHAQALHYKIPFGAYHFARPSQGSVTADADAFLAALSVLQYPCDLRPVLDLEVDPSTSRAWAQEWCKHVEAKLKVKPLLYSYPWYVQHLSGWPSTDLWIADLSHGPGRAHPPAVLHQYDWHKRIPGISGEVDYNYCMDLQFIRAKGHP